MRDARLQLKTFVFQVEQMRMAQVRLQDLKDGQKSETENAIHQIAEMMRQLEQVVDDSIREFSKNNQVRVAPEQVEADTNFQASLESNIKAWQDMLEYIQKEQIDQAMIDVKEGRKSARYEALEKREAELKANINEAQSKLGQMQDRVASPGFNSVVQQVINSAKA